LLASNRKKKHHIAQPPKMPILLISPPKIMLLKIPSYRNTHHDPARDTVERRGAVVGVHLVGGSLLQNERAKAIFFGGGSNNHLFGFQRWRLDLPFSVFCLNIFERAVVVFLWCGGVQDDDDGDG
jgi:hypothetical protein